MQTKALLENDRERVQARLQSANDTKEATAICENVLNRVLLQYNEQSPSDAARQAAAACLTTARAALPLMDSCGEIRTYERTLPAEKKTAGGWPAVAAGAGFSAAAGFFLTSAPAVLSPVGLALLVAGLIFMFIGGRTFGKNRGIVPEKEQILEVRPDADKIYHSLTGLLTVVDRHLEDVQLEDLQAKEHPAVPNGARTALPEDELQLLSGILTSAYANAGDPGAQAMISDIRFYLHKKGLEVTDYSEETSRYFNRISSRLQGTLRPAILQNDTVIVKGLAGDGRSI